MNDTDLLAAALRGEVVAAAGAYQTEVVVRAHNDLRRYTHLLKTRLELLELLLSETECPTCGRENKGGGDDAGH